MEAKTYVVQVPFVHNNKTQETGAMVDLNDRQANYLLVGGFIAPAPAPSTTTKAKATKDDASNT